MAVPKQRQNKARKGRRRSGQAKKNITGLVECSNCGAIINAHRVCPKCGYYKKKEFFKSKDKK